MRTILILPMALLSFSAFAADATPPSPLPPASPTAEPAPPPISCTAQSGSRIKPPAGGCASSFARTYDDKAIESTGATSVGDALRQLDPALQGGVRR